MYVIKLVSEKLPNVKFIILTSYYCYIFILFVDLLSTKRLYVGKEYK